MTGIFVVVLIGVVGVVFVLNMTSVNPPYLSVEEELMPAAKALNMLGDRQSGAGYSFLLPDTFVPADPPSADGLPLGTRSFAWAAAEDSDDRGSELRLWVMPDELDLSDALARMDTTGSRLGYHSDVVNKSSYRRIGSRYVAVRGLLDASTSRSTRKGVLYLLVDGDRTIMVIGMGVGQNTKAVQYMLDHAVRTIRRDNG